MSVAPPPLLTPPMDPSTSSSLSPAPSETTATPMDSETNARKRPSEDLPQDSLYEWRQVEDKKKRKKADKEMTRTVNGTTTVTDPSTGATSKNLPKRSLDKFKVIASNSTEGYIRGEWIVTPHDSKAMDTLTGTKEVNLQRLNSAKKLTKAVVLGLPLQIPEEDLTKLCNIASAERLKNREGYSTRTILCTFSGPVPEYVDMGHFGKYRTRPYVPEPMRCYHC